MFHLKRGIAAIALATVAMLVAGCMDQLPVEPDPFEIPDGHARMFLQASLGSAMVDELVIEVTAPDIAEPLVFNASITDGQATAEMMLPAGSDRQITVTAFSVAGAATHRGQATVTVQEGDNETVSLSLLPLLGDQGIEVTIASFQVQIEAGRRDFLSGEAGQLRILVRDSEGTLYSDQKAVWGSTNPDVVAIDGEGQFEALELGSAQIAAVYGGVAALTTVQVVSTSDYVQKRNLNAMIRAYEAWAWSPQFVLSTASFEHSAWPTNWGMVDWSTLPTRTALQNDQGYTYYGTIAWMWQAVGAAKWEATEALRILDGGGEVGENGDLNAEAEAHARLALGLAHAVEALLYDQGVVVSDWNDSHDGGDLVGYQDVMSAALGHLGDVIAIAEANPLQMPGWHTVGGMNSDQLIRYVRSQRARFRADVARTPAERESVDWAAVVADVDAGLTADFMLYYDQNAGLGEISLPYRIMPQWSAAGYHIYGMADQTGQYQSWLEAEPMGEAQPFDLGTPDLRFPQGETQSEQQANPGSYICWDASNVGAMAERGTWRWSNYRHCRFDYYLDNGWAGHLPALTLAELRLLKAEARYRQGNRAEAAALINETRVANGGLSAIGSDGTNADCVPRLPDATCGGLWEALKWEKRLETSMTGFARFFLDGRGWGDLAEGTALHFPVPAHVLEARGMGVYTFGGSGEGAAAASTYGF